MRRQHVIVKMEWDTEQNARDLSETESKEIEEKLEELERILHSYSR
jgi:hypothetical protein